MDSYSLYVTETAHHLQQTCRYTGNNNVAVRVVTTAGRTTDCATRPRYKRQQWPVASKTSAGARARHVDAAVAMVGSCVHT
jgi:hypothetical protein